MMEKPLPQPKRPNPVNNETKSTSQQYNLVQREPVLLSAPIIGAVADLLSGTGANSHWAGLAAALLVAVLRFVVTSPATAQDQEQQIEALRLSRGV